MAFRQAVGNLFDKVGTKFKLPEIGLSELLAGGRTTNTGTKPLAQNQALNYFSQGNRQADPSMAAEGGPQIDAAYLQQNWQQMGYSSPEQALQDNGFPLPEAQPANSLATAIASYGGNTGSSGGSSTAITPQYTYLNGQQYNITDPTQRAAFIQARNGQLQQQASGQINQYQDQINRSLRDAGITNARQLEDINMQMGELDKSGQENQRMFDSGVNDINQSYDLGTVNRANYFAQLSPNAFQSSQGTGQQFANNKRLEGLADTQRVYDENTGTINQNRLGLQRDQADLGQAYNAFLGDTQNDLNSFTTNANNFYTGQQDQARSGIDNYNQKAGVKDFSYNRQAIAPITLGQANINQFTPYTSFQSLSQSPEANYFAAATPKSNGLNAKDQYLGYSPTTQDKDYINQYLKRGY